MITTPTRRDRFLRCPAALALPLTLCLGPCLPAAAQPAPDKPPAPDVSALAKETQNPVANVVTLPFQFNFNMGGGFEDRAGLTLNVQPVIPIKLTDDWNLIARTVVPINSLPTGPDTRASGVGDVVSQLFFTPAAPGAVIWGVGPALSLPTSTALPTDTGTWGGGVSAVIVKNVGRVVLGGLVSQIWPMTDAGGAPETDVLTMQPFVNVNFGVGYAVSFAPAITANWDAASGEEWTVPLGIGISRTTVFNGRPMTLSAQYYRNVERPQSGPGHQLRLVVTLIFPQSRRP